jgi:PIN domain nuclease of toxin-antitoxin system
MRYMLETHSFLWFVMQDKSLSRQAQSLIEDPNNEIYFSVASVWEMAIKVSLEKITTPQPFPVFITEQLFLNRFTLLQISINHAAKVATLPFHHRDPFDRLLIAQSLVEQMPLISNETLFDAYKVMRLW